jgi:hypothetical protein
MNYRSGFRNSPDAQNIKAGATSLLQLVAGASAPPPPSNEQPGGILRLADATIDDLAKDDMETDE